MKQQSFWFYLVSLTIYLTVDALLPAGAATHPLAQKGRHICGVSDGWAAKRYGDQFRNRRYARSFSANLNTGEPRTVRMIYFLPNDRPYRADVVQNMKDEILNVQTFFAEQMQAHGYGRRTFRIETDAQGEPMVHRFDGKHPDSHYLDDTFLTVGGEVREAFNFEENVYLTVVDHSLYGISTDGIVAGGTGRRPWKNGGEVMVPSTFSWWLVAHELGHAFGLDHDFRDGRYIMSYGPSDWNQFSLSACHAEFLSVHTYFNSETPIDVGDRPSVEFISQGRYSASSQRVPIRLKVNDPDGIHQVILFAAQPHNRNTVKACRGLRGKTEAIVDFDYDGLIPSAHDPAYSSNTSLLNPLVHPIVVFSVDMNGNSNVWGGDQSGFLLFSETLQPLTKISGDNLQGLPNTPLPAPFVVEVRDLNHGYAPRGVFVTFTVTAGGGTLSVERTETDDSGRAESTLTLGPNLGVNTVEVTAAGATVTFTAVAGNPVEIPDPNLRAAIEAVSGGATGQPILPAHLEILEALYADSSNISDLTGLEHATNLKVLALDDNNITDLSPLSGLTNLGYLYLQRNAITDISPVQGLTSLIQLELGGNTITNISTVRGLINLTRLGLWSNNITDISPVAGLTDLIGLWIWSNNITDISAIKDLTNLTMLQFGENNISDISAVAGLTHLTELGLDGNFISDLSPLVKNTGLGSGDRVGVLGNPLSYKSVNIHIPALQKRGVEVQFNADGTRPPDVNGDGNVNVLDLLAVTSYLGDTGENIAADVNGDGVVDMMDLVLVAGTFESTPTAPAARSDALETLTAVEVRQWLIDARALERTDPTVKRGILVLEQLLVALTPTETRLLANYPNPFNPETWIPYQLSQDADVKLTIYDVQGIVVRQLALGHQRAGFYTDRIKAAHWDGRNNIGEQVASGVYFYHLRAGDYSATRRMLILK